MTDKLNELNIIRNKIDGDCSWWGQGDDIYWISDELMASWKRETIMKEALEKYSKLEIKGKDILESLPDGWTTKNFECDYGGKARWALEQVSDLEKN